MSGIPAIGAALAALTPDEPDLVVFNANVLTVDPKRPKAEAFAVKGENLLGGLRSTRTRCP